jgi:polysaccharide biosynthesis/export protein
MDEAKYMRVANAQALAIPRELEKEPLPSYTVEPGDVLIVQPIDLDSPARLPGDQPVLPDGTINLGKYGRLQVAGKTLPDIEGTVNGLVREQTKDAGFLSVRLVSRVSKVYYVVGEVNSPGAFQLAGRETVLDAIMAAGGLTDRASRDNIIMSRPSKPNCCRTVLPVCYRAIVQLGDTTTNYQIAPGDRIYVPSKTLCETLFGSKHSNSPCPCMSQNTPCNLPPYPGGPCPEDGHGHPQPFAPPSVAPPVSSRTTTGTVSKLGPLTPTTTSAATATSSMLLPPTTYMLTPSKNTKDIASTQPLSSSKTTGSASKPGTLAPATASTATSPFVWPTPRAYPLTLPKSTKDVVITQSPTSSKSTSTTSKPGGLAPTTVGSNSTTTFVLPTPGAYPLTPSKRTKDVAITQPLSSSKSTGSASKLGGLAPATASDASTASPAVPIPATPPLLPSLPTSISERGPTLEGPLTLPLPPIK